MSNTTNTDARLKSLKRRQALLRVESTDHSWVNILEQADLKYTSTIVQLSTGYISEDKLNKIEKVISKREALAV